MTKEGMCKICGKYSQLVKSHIIPRHFYHEYKKERFIAIDVNSKTQKNKQCGAYDYIVCEQCEKIFKPFDDEAYRILLREYSKYIKEQRKDGNIYQLGLNDFNYELLRNFFVSVLWRASVSKEFKNVNLGKYEDIAKDIFEGKNTYPNLFQTFIFKAPSNPITDKAVFIDKGRLFNRCIAYDIQMSSYTITVIVNYKPMPYQEKKLFEDLFIKKDNLYIIELENVHKQTYKKLLKCARLWMK